MANDKTTNPVPEGFRKIAQDDNAAGQMMASVFFNPETNEYFMLVMGADTKTVQGLGPITANAFFALERVVSDVEDMKKRYFYLG